MPIDFRGYDVTQIVGCLQASTEDIDSDANSESPWDNQFSMKIGSLLCQ
jgi:hypothetical protein